MEKTIKRAVNHPLEKLKKLFSTKVIWCAVVLYVLISILSGIGVEFALDKELLSKVYSFRQAYPLIAKYISAFLKAFSMIIPACAFLSVFYLGLATQFKLATLIYDKKNDYFEIIKLILYFKTTWIITLALALSQYALLLTVQDRLNGLWTVYFLITFTGISIFNISLFVATLFGSGFFVCEIKKYWKEIKSFYFLPCLYPIATILYYIAGWYYFAITFYYLRGDINFLRYSSLQPIFILIGPLVVIIIGILWLDYKRSAKYSSSK